MDVQEHLLAALLDTYTVVPSNCWLHALLQQEHPHPCFTCEKTSNLNSQIWNLFMKSHKERTCTILRLALRAASSESLFCSCSAPSRAFASPIAPCNSALRLQQCTGP